MAQAELAVAVLWHLHQPDYVDSATGRAAMPWVRLHSLLSYYDTVRVVREIPDARATFNLTPVLLQQLHRYVAGEVQDDFLALARPDPAELSAADRTSLLRRFFAFNHSRRFAELPRLAELWQKRTALGETPAPEETPTPAEPPPFDDRELRDLQVGFHLAWTGRTLREHDLVKALFAKGQGFTEQEKCDLLDLQQEFLHLVLPAYGEAARAGVIEISCTPCYHPILPLLCDTHSALEARPDLELPAIRFQQPGDAWYHVRTALDETERLLGVRPAGMWPAEGSLSEEAIRVFATEGVRWLGCDREVLAASLEEREAPEGGHYQPFRWGGNWAPALFFRDQELSDRIGFVYSSWPPAKAAADLVARLQKIRSTLPAGRFLVPLMLDGENPWESYSSGGMPFLQEMYRQVAGAEGLAWTSYGEYLDRQDEQAIAPLERLCAGSWIRHDFSTWIGHPEKNSGWERLHEVREWLQGRLADAGVLRDVPLAGSDRIVTVPDPDLLGPTCDTDLARSWRALAAAEGSDWFWWYGDEHPTEFAVEFDALFRGHLSNVYRHLGQEPDPILKLSLLQAATALLRPPRFPLQVHLDGKVTGYYEWLDAGQCDATGGETMHRTDVPIARLYYGGDPDHLYLRLDPPAGQDLGGLAGLTLTVSRFAKVAAVVALRFPDVVAGKGQMKPVPETEPGRGAPVEGVFDRVVEIAIPWSRLGLTAGQRCEFFVSLDRGAETELVLPAGGALSLRVPVGPEDADDWIV